MAGVRQQEVGVVWCCLGVVAWQWVAGCRPTGWGWVEQDGSCGHAPAVLLQGVGAAAAPIVQLTMLYTYVRCRLAHSTVGNRRCHLLARVTPCCQCRFLLPSALCGASLDCGLLHACCGSLLSCRHGRRRFLVLSYFLSIIAFITLFGVLTIPDIAREGAEFVTRLKSDNVWVILVEKMRDGLG